MMNLYKLREPGKNVTLAICIFLCVLTIVICVMLVFPSRITTVTFLVDALEGQIKGFSFVLLFMPALDHLLVWPVFYKWWPITETILQWKYFITFCQWPFVHISWDMEAYKNLNYTFDDTIFMSPHDYTNEDIN